MTKIENIEHLKKMVKEGKRNFYVSLNHGLRSSKIIDYEDKVFYINNEIDDTFEDIDENKIGNHIIGDAIKKGACYCYGF